MTDDRWRSWTSTAAVRQAGHPVLHADWEHRLAEADAALDAAQEEDGRT